MDYSTKYVQPQVYEGYVETAQVDMTNYAETPCNCGCEKCKEAEYQTISSEFIKINPQKPVFDSQNEAPPNPENIESVAPENIKVTPTENQKTTTENPSVVVAQPKQETATPTQETSDWTSWVVIVAATAMVATAIVYENSQTASSKPQEKQNVEGLGKIKGKKK